MIFFAGRESGPLQVRLMLDNQRYASGDVTLNRAWIPPLYLTWD